MARLIEAELVAVCVNRFGTFLDRQLPPGRNPIVTAEAAEIEVRFALRDAIRLPNGEPDAYIVLRELRFDDESGRPSMYWYGLVQRSSVPDSYYEAFHLHDEPERGPFAHFQQERRSNGRLVEYRQEPLPAPTHVIPAVERLLESYYRELAGREPDG